MLASQYSYDDCLRNSVKNAWTIEDCFQHRDFDFARLFLPERIAGVEGIACLDAAARRKLNQVRANSYFHIFAFVEEYIVPMVLDHARRDVFGDEVRLRFLLRFAEEETKHQAMLRRAMAQFEAGFGVSCGVIPGREEVARVVLGKSPLTALLLTSMIEWFTQLHYIEHVRDGNELDPLVRDILKFHWIDEAQHAKADTLLIQEVAAGMDATERERAVDELLELGGAVDGLLARQVDLDIESLAAATGRRFTGVESEDICTRQRRAYRWTFLVSGLEHPEFVETIGELTKAGARKIAAAAKALSAA
jgi:hypothetical protein